MKKLTTIYLAALTLVLSSMLVMADDEAIQKFEYLDSDGNGFISKSEATQNIKLRERWNNVDKNKDGKLTQKEFKKFASVPNDPYPE